MLWRVHRHTQVGTVAEQFSSLGVDVDVDHYDCTPCTMEKLDVFPRPDRTDARLCSSTCPGEKDCTYCAVLCTVQYVQKVIDAERAASQLTSLTIRSNRLPTRRPC